MSSDQEQSKLQSYSEMIIEAIKSLKQNDGSNQTSTSDYLESKYAEKLPEGHQNLITAHLARMVESGEIVLKNNNYTKPNTSNRDDDEPSAKRWRGRPQKVGEPVVVKSPLSESGEKRGRGRPPKPKDPMAEAAEKAVKGMPKPRGSPSKAASEHGSGGEEVRTPVSSGVKRGRGRPPKEVKAAAFADVGFACGTECCCSSFSKR